MNCQEFQNHFNDARDNRASSDEAQAHAQSCHACEEFAREQNLTNCLRGLAASTAACQSSPAVETALRQAFRQHHAPQVTVAASTIPVFDDMRNEATDAPEIHKQESYKQAYEQIGISRLVAAQTANVWRMHRSVFASVIIAAVCLATFGVFAPRRNTTESANKEISFVGSPARQTDASPTFIANQATSPNTLSSTSSSDLTADAAATRIASASYIQNAGYTNGGRRTAPRPRLKTNDRTMRESKLVEPENQSLNEQVATQFFPLDDGLSMPVESGHLMKIEMPRSALASFGLPTSIERANELVKAEVLVGTDGIARAIRFVR